MFNHVSLLSQADGPLKPSWTSDLCRPAGSGCWTEPTGPPEASCLTGSGLRTWEQTEKSVWTNHSTAQRRDCQTADTRNYGYNMSAAALMCHDLFHK